MPVDEQWEVLAALRRHPPHMPGHGGGNVQAFPAHDLRAPGQVAVLTEGEELIVEELAFDRDVLDETAAKHGRRTARTEDVLHAIVLPAIDFFGSAIKMAHVACEVNSGGVDDVGTARVLNCRVLKGHAFRRAVEVSRRDWL